MTSISNNNSTDARYLSTIEVLKADSKATLYIGGNPDNDSRIELVSHSEGGYTVHNNAGQDYGCDNDHEGIRDLVESLCEALNYEATELEYDADDLRRALGLPLVSSQLPNYQAIADAYSLTAEQLVEKVTEHMARENA